MPFIARYRKEATGELDEVQIRLIQERLDYHNALNERRETILKSIEEQIAIIGSAAEGFRQDVIAYLWSRMATVATRQLDAGGGNSDLLTSKQVSAQYYFDKLLPEAQWLLRDIQSGKGSMMALTDEQWVS